MNIVCESCLTEYEPFLPHNVNFGHSCTRCGHTNTYAQQQGALMFMLLLLIGGVHVRC
jgi:hypothetical protein